MPLYGSEQVFSSGTLNKLFIGKYGKNRMILKSLGDSGNIDIDYELLLIPSNLK